MISILSLCRTSLCAVPIAVLITGCMGGEPINCTHDTVKDLVTQIADDQVYGLVELLDMNKDSLTDDEYIKDRQTVLRLVEGVIWELTYARPTHYDENVGIYSCSADLSMKLPVYNEQSSAIEDYKEESNGITYTAQVVEGQVLVEVRGLEQFTLIQSIQTQKEYYELLNLGL